MKPGLLSLLLLASVSSEITSILQHNASTSVTELCLCQRSKVIQQDNDVKSTKGGLKKPHRDLVSSVQWRRVKTLENTSDNQISKHYGIT